MQNRLQSSNGLRRLLKEDGMDATGVGSPDMAFDVIEDNGVPAGRLYLDRQDKTLLIVDLALLPDWRNRGIGTALIEAVFAEARLCGKEVSISVEKFNPAQRLYRRLGFREYAEDNVYWFMYWQPEAKPASEIG